jgi:PKD repeat protein
VRFSQHQFTLAVNDSVVLGVTQGSGHHTFSVISGDGVIDASTGRYTAPTTAGTAEVEVKDTDGTSDTAAVTIDPALTISPASETLAVNDIFIFTSSGGVSPYQYAVSSGNGTVDGTGKYTAPSAAGSATVTITDSAGNSASATVTVNPALALSPASSIIAVNDVLALNATGGVAPYTFSIAAGGGSVNASGQYTASSSAGSATVQVTDSEGHVATSAVTINSALALAPASATIAASDAVTFTASGGVPPYSYTVFSGGGTISGSGAYTAPSATGTAVVRVTDAVANSVSASITINPAMAIAPVTKTLLVGTSSSFGASGGVPPYAFSVVTGGAGGTIDSSGAYTAPASAGTDTVRVADSIGNAASAAVTVVAVLSISPASYAMALGNSGVFLGNGGFPPYSYSVSGMAGGTISSAGVYTPTSLGIATVTVTDSTGSKATAAVTVNAALSISPTTHQMKPTATEALTVTGGVTPYGFTVSGSAGGAVSSGIYTPAGPGSATITVTDAQGNTASASVTVNNLSLSPVIFSVGLGQTATFAASGGTPPYVYSVASGGVGSIDSGGNFTSSVPGSATIQVTDAQSNTATANILVQLTICDSSVTSASDSSGTLYSAGGSLENYARNTTSSSMTCSFLIQPAANAGAPIQLSFPAFNLDNNFDYLAVYDGTSTSGKALFTGSGFTGSTLPPTLLATTGAMYVVMTLGVGDLGQSGFTASWTQLAANTPVAGFTASLSTAALGQSITFTDTSTSAPTSWSWNFNGEGSSTSQNPAFAFTTEGLKNVTLTVSNASGTSSVTEPLLVGPRLLCADAGGNLPLFGTDSSPSGVLFTSGGPGGNFSIGDVCGYLIQPGGTQPPGFIDLHFVSFSTNTDFQWVDVYDGTSASGRRLTPAGGFSGPNVPPDLVAVSGAMFVVFNAPNPACLDGYCWGEPQIGNPLPGFEATWTSGPAGGPGAFFSVGSPTPVGQPVQFTDASTNSPTSWAWDFDGSGSVESTAQNPTYTYTNPGIYTASLTVANAQGSSTTTQQVNVGTAIDLCSSVTTTSSASGFVYTSGGPGGGYQDLQDCGLLILAPPGAAAITLSFTSFSLEDRYDILQVFDGMDATGTQLGLNACTTAYSLYPAGWQTYLGFTGTILPPTLTATSGAMYLHFASDQLVTWGGFAAQWSSE